MSSLSLHIGLKALLGARTVLDTIGHNMANANTPGYSRQRVDLAAGHAVERGGRWVGSGVRDTRHSANCRRSPGVTPGRPARSPRKPRRAPRRTVTDRVARRRGRRERDRRPDGSHVLERVRARLWTRGRDPPHWSDPVSADTHGSPQRDRCEHGPLRKRARPRARITRRGGQPHRRRSRLPERPGRPG